MQPSFKTKQIARKEHNGRPNPHRANFRPNKFGNQNAQQQFQRGRDEQPRFQRRVDNRQPNQPQKRPRSPEKNKPQVDAPPKQ